MATYLVGDLQGCYDELQLLLEKVKFDPTKDQLYLVGDLVARGDKSLECLRFVKSLGQSAKTVLGNHDLHLISTALGIKRVKPRDRVDAIFNAPDFNELINWLRHQPLLIHNELHNFVMVHAGISPDWNLATAKRCANEVEEVLRNGNYHHLIENMYQNHPDRWDENLHGLDRLRYSINVFTRMRFCYWDHRLDFDCKQPPESAPEELTPWFNLDNPLYQNTPIVFGHWASLVDTPTPTDIYALDTGCVWGNRMTMLRWEDKQYFTQPAVKNYNE
ncbi:bis(5'-nucleosyl)-tetraphosphatase (symmetrical) ApaH [Pasteurella dagmatis]|uniref:Bis(5'-nucleosyl)-tetraphosphatase, symmetrical n=1 Tax=Pasteurella dagmatis ATCC 43325 TaxID=667128 RepID=C9PM48_9PAST|nr:bis(5'-nucleosyl)-tetraphosphatase (symmetrical) ApaH [Pasteurella dagmatis]EEX51268.1 bis(5'-nucleosyl)-tetraphosphatase [Pasteurella dagmatis ATCC 43325]SNV84769.1 bis(5'-nucleosyl)-tetraphosphatase, symmetrical [Pasteurella dagmatis]